MVTAIPALLPRDRRLQRVLRRLAASKRRRSRVVLQEHLPSLRTPDGEEILIENVGPDLGFRVDGSQFRLMADEGRWAYRNLTTNDGTMFCYTPWKDQNGHYWAWTYAPFGRGTLPEENPDTPEILKGRPSLRALNLVRCRTRKLAKEKALRRRACRA